MGTGHPDAFGDHSCGARAPNQGITQMIAASPSTITRRTETALDDLATAKRADVGNAPKLPLDTTWRLALPKFIPFVDSMATRGKEEIGRSTCPPFSRGRTKTGAKRTTSTRGCKSAVWGRTKTSGEVNTGVANGQGKDKKPEQKHFLHFGEPRFSPRMNATGGQAPGGDACVEGGNTSTESDGLVRWRHPGSYAPKASHGYKEMGPWRRIGSTGENPFLI